VTGTLTENFHWALLPFIFASGLCIGSFLNVVIHRLPLEESVVKPRSRCPSCKKLIPWYYNIPVLSFLFLRARCANCKAPVSWRYPLVELVTAFLFTAAAWNNPVWYEWPWHFYFLGALIACTFIDLDHWILPDKITLPGIVIGLAGAAVLPSVSFQNAVLGFLFGGGLLYLVAWGYHFATKKDGLGGGDIKFLAMVGSFLGLQGALMTIVLASMVGSVIGIFLILVKGRKGSSAIPFGPFLSAGAAVAFFFGQALWEWYFHLRSL
jgi:leader peptidase (prepilin peptidase)/N-methyltransferase